MTDMNWKKLISTDQLEKIKTESEQKPILIFKHSTRCSTSRMSLDRLERNWKSDQIEPYFLDLLSYREVSDLIAEQFGVDHESPQAILIVKGKPVLALSHFEIDFNEIQKAVRS